jgi:hypothetical protein
MAGFCHAKSAGSLAHPRFCADEGPSMTQTSAIAAIEYLMALRNEGFDALKTDMRFSFSPSHPHSVVTPQFFEGAT